MAKQSKTFKDVKELLKKRKPSDFINEDDLKVFKVGK